MAKPDKMRWLRATLVIAGAVVGTVCGWLMAKNDQNYMHVAWGAFTGGVVGWFLSDFLS